jgi:hypothetical protein
MRPSTFNIFVAGGTSSLAIITALTGNPYITASAGGIAVMSGLYAIRAAIEEVTTRKANLKTPVASPSKRSHPHPDPTG